MSEKINRLIPKAMLAIETSGMMKANRVVPAEFKGYIASMAASIIQTGLLTSITFYTRGTRDGNEGSGKAEDTNKLLKAIYKLINPNTEDETDSPNNLLFYALETCKNEPTANEVKMEDINIDKLLLLEEEIQDALYALKLALRTFKLEKTES